MDMLDEILNEHRSVRYAEHLADILEAKASPEFDPVQIAEALVVVLRERRRSRGPVA